jgi:hypothetical protein
MIASRAEPGAACRGAVCGNTASCLPSGEKAPPTAKPPGSGLRTVRVARVAVSVIVIRQLSGNGQDAGSQASRLERAPGGV